MLRKKLKGINTRETHNFDKTSDSFFTKKGISKLLGHSLRFYLLPLN